MKKQNLKLNPVSVTPVLDMLKLLAALSKHLYQEKGERHKKHRRMQSAIDLGHKLLQQLLVSVTIRLKFIFEPNTTVFIILHYGAVKGWQ